VESRKATTTIIPDSAALHPGYINDCNNGHLTTQWGEMLYAIEDGCSKRSKDYFVEKLMLRWDAWRYALDHIKNSDPEAAAFNTM
jgi:hypothetical protein